VAALFLPESPRWLYTNNKRQQAHDVLTKLHGHGNANSEWVKLQLHEYEEFLELEGSDKKWWDYRALFRTRAAFYRLTCNCIVSCFGQWVSASYITLSPLLLPLVLILKNCTRLVTVLSPTFSVLSSTQLVSGAQPIK
jgi:hypothetical protein